MLPIGTQKSLRSLLSGSVRRLCLIGSKNYRPTTSATSAATASGVTAVRQR